ncbi:MAG: hypothetical protein FJ184_12940 [Gammaproteobacteria bacterium]|nr:hypothetical protein [Gammaproteobacteria bacterium]
MLKTYQKLNGQIFIPVSADLERYDFLNLCAAVGSKRLNRKIAASGIYFDVGTHDPKELFEQCKIYFYDVGVDYGPYSNLPPYVSRILTPFKDYFIISGEAVAERPFSFGFAPVKITSDESEFTGEALEINFSEQFQLARVQLVANTGVDLKVDFESKQVELRFNGGVSRLFTFESAVTDIKHTTEVLSRWLSQ